MNHTTSSECPGDPQQALLAAVLTLTGVGFTIEEKSDVRARAIGPGLNSTRQNPLLGASEIVLNAETGKLSLNAELGGVEFMRKFILRFPIGLGLLLGVLLGVINGLILGKQFGAGFGIPAFPGWQWMAVCVVGGLLAVSPWFFLGPVMARSIENKTRRALDTLVRNATTLSD